MHKKELLMKGDIHLVSQWCTPAVLKENKAHVLLWKKRSYWMIAHSTTTL
jgi:hypothetical protein